MRGNRRDVLRGLGAGVALVAMPAVVRAQGADIIRIGALNPITGSGSPYGSGMQKTIFAAAEAVNAAGGAGGRKIEIVAEDGQTSPQAAVLAAKKLIEINKVSAILGTWSSGVSLAVAPLAENANVLLMHTSGAPALSTPKVNGKGLFFRFHANNERSGAAFAELCKRRKFTRPATMAFNNASGIGNVDGFRKTWEAGGGKVVESVVYEPNQPSYRSELQKVLAANPDVIVTGSYLADTTIILREWFQTGQAVAWAIPGWAVTPELIRAIGPTAAEGIMSVDAISNEDDPAFKAFDAAYQKAMSKPGQSNVYAAECWDMVNCLTLAIEAAGGSVDANTLKAKIREVANPDGQKVGSFAEGKAALKKGKINYEGASSALDFDATGDVKPTFGAWTVEGGKLVQKYKFQA
ncbi:MAG: ABC transporter substrate-binding protein [Rhizobiales bacterium]|nr:ABC transporter substrate-binding protein [Hyphomicrobiales bacterium]